MLLFHSFAIEVWAWWRRKQWSLEILISLCVRLRKQTKAKGRKLPEDLSSLRWTQSLSREATLSNRGRAVRFDEPSLSRKVTLKIEREARKTGFDWFVATWKADLAHESCKQQENDEKKSLKYDFTIEARLLLRLASKDEIVIGVQSEFLRNSG